MIPFRAFFALPAAGLLAAVAAAQLDAAQQPEDRAPARPAAAAPPDPAAERTEDVEVLRRILNKSLGLPDKVTVNPNLVPYNPGGFGGGGGIGGFGGQPGGFGGIAGQPGGIGGFGGGGIGGFQGGGFSGQGWYPGVVGDGFQIPPGPLYGTTTTYVRSQPQVGPFDGVYLPGHGVVYTLRVPEHVGIVLDPPAKAFWLATMCLKCHTTEPVSRAELEPPADKAKPPTEWDRTREELRGAARPAERPKAPGKVSRQQICEPGNLTERVVTKLFQNARHLRHLPAGEHVTVVVTFDGAVGSARHRTTIDLGSGTSIGADPSAAKGPAGKAGFTPEEAQKLTLGDLHLKQNKPKEAADAYRQALTRYKDLTQRVTPPAGLTPAQQTELAGELQKGVRDAYAKLAQAFLAAGDAEKAQAALDMARKFKIELAAADAPAKEKSVPVPAKLVISVAKADLDRAGDDPAAFRKAVKVETVGFPPADKKKP